MTDDPRREAVARWLAEWRYGRQLLAMKQYDADAMRLAADGVLAAADAAAPAVKAPEPPRREDWHYDRDGYCDNPGRGY